MPDAGRKKDLDEALTQFRQALDSDASLQAYLGGRAISREIADKYRIGVVPEGCSIEWEKYRGYIAIPYLTRSGPVTIRFRRPPDRDSGPKYMSLPGDKPRLFNVGVLAMPYGDTLAIVEGEIDAISVTEYAGLPAIGVPGVSSWSDTFSRMVKDYDRILVVGDGDEAGRNFADGLAEELEAIAVTLPDAQDCNSILVEQGPLVLRDLLGL